MTVANMKCRKHWKALIACALMILATAFPVCTGGVGWAQTLARMNVGVVGGGVAAAGGGAASNQIVDPNETVSVTGNYLLEDGETAASYISIDDGASANDADYITSYAPDPQDYCVFGTAEPSAGTISTVRVHLRMRCSAAISSDAKVAVSNDGSTWTSASSNVGSVTTSFADYTKDFTELGWSGATALRVRLYGNAAFGEWCQYSRIRVEINP